MCTRVLRDTKRLATLADIERESSEQQHDDGKLVKPVFTSYGLVPYLRSGEQLAIERQSLIHVQIETAVRIDVRIDQRTKCP